MFRPVHSGAHSIETVFGALSAAMRDSGVEVVDYVLRGRSRLAEDLLALRRIQADIYHVTGDVCFMAALLPSAKTVLTVHDIGHYLYDLKGWRRVVYRWLWLSLPMRCSAAVTVSSAATTDTVRAHLGSVVDRTRLVELCYSPLLVAAPRVFDRIRPKILQVGTGTNKNVLRLIEALEGIDCELIIVGRLTSDIRQELDSRNVRHSNYVDVSPERMVELYAAVDLVAFVSLNEGFGMPIIEAQVMGKALITSDRPPMSEVAGPDACLVDPSDIGAIREGVMRLIEDEEYRSKTIQDGLRNVARFSPSSAASRFLEVYQDVIGHV